LRDSEREVCTGDALKNTSLKVHSKTDFKMKEIGFSFIMENEP